MSPVPRNASLSHPTLGTAAWTAAQRAPWDPMGKEGEHRHSEQAEKRPRARSAMPGPSRKASTQGLAGAAQWPLLACCLTLGHRLPAERG